MPEEVEFVSTARQAMRQPPEGHLITSNQEDVVRPMLIAVLLVIVSCPMVAAQSSEGDKDGKPTFQEALESAILAADGGNASDLEKLIKTSSPTHRQEILQNPGAWVLLKMGRWEAFVTLLCLMLVCVGAIFGSRGLQGCGDGAPETKKDSTGGAPALIMNRPLELFARDWEPISWDSSLHRMKATPSQYRGAINWIRDITEKLLSVALLIGFVLLMARASGYFVDWASGEGWRLLLIPIDINFALTLIGFALILDSFVVVSTMTDAPGIGRTIDAVIVVLAGFVVMLVEAVPGANSFVEFRFGPHPDLAASMAKVIGLLFVIRWLIRNRDLREMLGLKAQAEPK
jgi:hypothetical protein